MYACFVPVRAFARHTPEMALVLFASAGDNELMFVTCLITSAATGGGRREGASPRRAI